MVNSVRYGIWVYMEYIEKIFAIESARYLEQLQTQGEWGSVANDLGPHRPQEQIR